MSGPLRGGGFFLLTLYTNVETAADLSPQARESDDLPGGSMAVHRSPANSAN